MEIIFIIVPLIAGFWWSIIYPRQQLKRFRNAGTLQINGAEKRYPNLPLENFGILYSDNLKSRRVQVVFPKLESEGRIKYIFSWHSFHVVRIPRLSRLQNISKGTFQTGKEIKILIKEHLEIDSEIEQLTKQWHELYNLRDLVATSDLYSNQLNTYERGLAQIEQLKNKAEQLEQIYLHAIRESLIGRQIADYDLPISPEQHLNLDSQYRKVKSEYQIMKETASIYTNLLQQRPL